MSYKAIVVAAAALLSSSAVFANAEVLGTADLSGGRGPLVSVQYYGPGYYYDGGVLDIPGEVVAGAEGIVGDVLAGPGYGYEYGYGYGPSGAAACARQFRSFDPATGTYTTYSGEQVLCPYLRG